jgi:hypothetical protein
MLAAARGQAALPAPVEPSDRRGYPLSKAVEKLGVDQNVALTVLGSSGDGHRTAQDSERDGWGDADAACLTIGVRR